MSKRDTSSRRLPSQATLEQPMDEWDSLALLVLAVVDQAKRDARRNDNDAVAFLRDLGVEIHEARS